MSTSHSHHTPVEPDVLIRALSMLTGDLNRLEANVRSAFENVVLIGALCDLAETDRTVEELRELIREIAATAGAVRLTLDPERAQAGPPPSP